MSLNMMIFFLLFFYSLPWCFCTINCDYKKETTPVFPFDSPVISANDYDRRDYTSRDVLGKKSTTKNVLLEWCVSDTNCANLYNQDKIINTTVFSFLTRGLNENEAPLEEELDEICGKEEIEVLKTRWIQKMVTHFLEKDLYCDEKHKFVVDTTNMKISCMCLENVQCNETIHDKSSFRILLIIIIVLAALILITILSGLIYGLYIAKYNTKKNQ